MEIRLAVDNDIILKGLRYGLESDFWPEPETVGVLGAARYVIAAALERDGETRGLQNLEALLGQVARLEPEAREIEFAAQIERRAAAAGLELDGGESQLAAMVCCREIAVLETGDKRAIAAFEELLDECEELGPLRDAVSCLEQIVHRLASGDRFAELAVAICAMQGVDVALDACFRCHSGGGASRDEALEGLDSYIGALRARAPRVLVASP